MLNPAIYLKHQVVDKISSKIALIELPWQIIFHRQTISIEIFPKKFETVSERTG